MQFKICLLLIINHINSIVTEQPWKKCETWGAYTYLHSSAYCTIFTFYNHSVTFEHFSTKSRMLEALSIKSARISETLVTAEGNSSQSLIIGELIFSWKHTP